MVFINLNSKPDWVFERNPFGTVPILEYKGSIVYESAVCDEFLEEAFPASVTGTHALLPSCPFERAAVRLLMLKFEKVFHIINIIAFAFPHEKLFCLYLNNMNVCIMFN